MTHSRLRRASSITHFALSAVLEALEGFGRNKPEQERLGIITATHAACLRYSARLCGEVVTDPTTTSPLIFPETVINAPVSHLAAYLGGVKLTQSLIGDQTAFIQALVVAAKWLLSGLVDACIVVASEEVAWPLADAMRLFARKAICSEGAGAVMLALKPGETSEVVLERVTNAFIYAGQRTKHLAAAAMRSEFPAQGENEILVDARCGIPRVDDAERTAWLDWSGPRISPRVLLGEALSAATAWQCVVAFDAVSKGRARAANVSAVGGNQQAIGVRFHNSP